MVVGALRRWFVFAVFCWVVCWGAIVFFAWGVTEWRSRPEPDL
jgi:hypothetical protein